MERLNPTPVKRATREEANPMRTVLKKPKRKSGLSNRFKYQRRETPFGGKSRTDVGLNDENMTRIVGMVRKKRMVPTINPTVIRPP
jgi:hypothetical protein